MLNLTEAPSVANPYAGAVRQPSPSRALPPEAKPSRRSRVAAFLFGLGSRLNVQLIGYMPLAEIASLLATPYALPKITSPAIRKLTGWILPLGFLWMANAVFTDMFMQSEWKLAARGFARIVIYMVCIPLFTAFLRRDAYAKTILFTLGQIPSGILSAYFLRSGVHEGREATYGRSAEISFETHWGAVFGLGAQLALLLIYPRSRLLAYGIGLGMAVYQLVGGSRATAGIYLLGVTVCIVRDFFETRGGLRTREKKLLKWVALAVLGSAVGIAGFRAYQFYASTGQLGDKAFQKYQTQSRSAYGILFGGRPQVLGGWLAAKKSPIIGYGSWPMDEERFFAEACDILDLNLDPNYYRRGYPLIPTHSHVFGAWVENGIMGLVFWVYVFSIMARCSLARYQDSRFGIFLVISCVSAMWHIVFSPMAGRLEQSFLLGLLLNQTSPATAENTQPKGAVLPGQQAYPMAGPRG